MRLSPRRAVPFLAILAAWGSLGAAAVLFPALAGSETTPAIDAVQRPDASPGEEYAWSPEQQSVAAGGSVSFANGTPGVPHGIVWTGGPGTPACVGVPIGRGEEGWKGSCTFSREGTYTFRCAVHPYMHGTVLVTTQSIVLTSTTSSTAAAAIEAAPPAIQPVTGSKTGAPQPSGHLALTLASVQHGGSVRGVIQVPPVAAGGTLVIELFTRAAAPGKGRRPGEVAVGRLVRTSLPTGTLLFAARLNRAGRAALTRRRALLLTAMLTLRTGSQRVMVALKRRVVLRI